MFWSFSYKNSLSGAKFTMWKKQDTGKRLAEAIRVNEVSVEIFPIYSADDDYHLFLGEVYIDAVKSSCAHDLPSQA